MKVGSLCIGNYGSNCRKDHASYVSQPSCTILCTFVDPGAQRDDHVLLDTVFIFSIHDQ